MVKTKFKQTEIGLIPEDWEVEVFTDIFDFLSTASYSRANLNSTGNIGYIHYGDIHTKIGYYLNTNKYVSGYISKEQLKNYSIVQQGDLIMADASEDYAGVGKGSEVINVPEINIIAGLHTFLIRGKKSKIALGFKAYFHSNPLIKKQYDALASGLKVYSLSKSAFKNIQIPLPPLPEQQAIAKALSDTDVWIESLEKLIDKKKLFKQGAMQNLLTPKEDWDEVMLRDVGKTYAGLSGKTKKDFGNGNAKYIPFLNVIRNISIDISFLDTVNIKQGEMQNKVLKYDILLNTSSETAEELALPSTLLSSVDNMYLNSFCFGFRLHDSNVNPLFLSYLIRSTYGRKLFFHLAQGATRYNISKANFLNLEILLPKELSEQTRIATILSDMDAEIEVLEMKLYKAKQLKQGIMQELLTGRIRLVEASRI